MQVRVSGRAHKMSKSRGNVINPDDVVQVGHNPQVHFMIIVGTSPAADGVLARTHVPSLLRPGSVRPPLGAL